MRDTGRIVVALAFLVLLKGEAPRGGYCIEKQCFLFFQDQVDFVTAQEHCSKNYEGHLMTVRSLISHSILLILLGIHTGDYWIGLQLPDQQCPDQDLVLRGFRWTTGDIETKFQNWRRFNGSCSSKCISVSKYDFTWKKQICNNKINGFICEIKIESSCQRVKVVGDESVVYDTLYGFRGDNLPALPQGTIATLTSVGSKYICVSEQWMKAPWSCEVYNGGCAHACTSVNHTPVCTCSPGKTLQYNNVTCEDDPCRDSGCAHLCQKKDDSSYTCTCHHGHALANDGKNCDVIDYCVDDARCPMQNTECVNVPASGGFECRCIKGYDMENGTCVKFDACFMSPCEQICTSTDDDSYTCSCNNGFIPMPKDPIKCQYGCLEATCPPECDKNSDKNQCRCPKGYILDEVVCVDIDECESDSCPQNCTNTYGSFMCSCYEGFDLLVDWYTCVKRELPEGSGWTTQHTPNLRPPTETASPVKAGVFLGMIAIIVVVILVMVILIHIVLKRRGNLDITFENQSVTVDDLQHFKADKYQKIAFDRFMIYDNQYAIG